MKYLRLIALFVCATFITIFADLLISSKQGEDFQLDGCSCHGIKSTNTEVNNYLDGDKYVMVGERVGLRMTIKHPYLQYFGMVAGVTDAPYSNVRVGEMHAGSGTKLATNAVVHSGSTLHSQNSITYTYSWTAPMTAGTYYLHSAGIATNNNGNANGDQHNHGLQKPIIVYDNPFIDVIEPVQVRYCVGETVTIRWEGAMVGTVNILLSRDNGATYQTVASNIPQGANLYEFNATTYSEIPYLFKVVSNDHPGIEDIAPVAFYVNRAPQLASQIKLENPCLDANPFIYVRATGGYITYTWLKDGIDIQNYSNDTLWLSEVPGDPEGMYQVILNSGCGSTVSSNPFNVNINDSLKFTRQPIDIDGCIGEEVKIIAFANGSNPTYQWYRGSEILNGFTNYELVFPKFDESLVGEYHVVAMNPECGTEIISDTVTLKIGKPARFDGEVELGSYCEGEEVIMRIATEGENIEYQWYLGDDPIEGQTDSIFTIDSVTASDAGWYSVTINNSCTVDERSNLAELKIIEKIVLESQPENKKFVPGKNLIIFLDDNDVSDEYEWYRNDELIATTNSGQLVIDNADASSEGVYYVVISNRCMSVKTENFIVSIDNGIEDISLSTEEVDFGLVEVGTTRSRQIEVTNNTNLDISIDSIWFDEYMELYEIDLNLPMAIQANSTLPIDISYSPDYPEYNNTSIYISTSNEATSTALLRSGAYDFENMIELSFVGDSVGYYKSGESATLVLEVLNHGPDEYHIKDIRFPDNGVDMSSDFDSNIRFRGRENSEFSVTYTNNTTETERTETTELTFGRLGMQDTVVSTSVNFELTLSVDEYESNFKLYPNPVLDFIKIELGDEFEYTSYKVVSISGQIVLSGDIISNELELSTHNIPKGSYLIILEKDDGRMSRVKFEVE